MFHTLRQKRGDVVSNIILKQIEEHVSTLPAISEPRLPHNPLAKMFENDIPFTLIQKYKIWVFTMFEFAATVFNHSFCAYSLLGSSLILDNTHCPGCALKMQIHILWIVLIYVSVVILNYAR